MNILLIGIEDAETLKEYLKKVFTTDIRYFYVDDLQKVMKVVDDSYVDFFVIDTKYGYSEIKQLIETLIAFPIVEVRGAYVCNEVNNKLNILALNLGSIDGILFRPYNMEDFHDMKVRIERRLGRQSI